MIVSPLLQHGKLEDLYYGNITPNAQDMAPNSDMYAEQYIKPRLGNKKMNSITAVDIQRMYTKLMKEGRVREHPEHGRTLSAGTIKTDGGFETGETKTGQGRRKILLLQSTQMSFGKGSGKLSANGFSPT